MVSPVAIEILLERVHTLLDRGETSTVIDILRRLHPADSSEILFLIPPDAQNLMYWKSWTCRNFPGKRWRMYWKSWTKKRWWRSFTV